MNINSETYSVTALHTSERERLLLLTLNLINNTSWPKIGRLLHYYPIPFTSLYMWAKGQRPLADEHRLRLGIPVKIPTLPCTACGKVHNYDRACEMRVIVKEKTKPRKQQDRHPRYYAWMFEQLTKAHDW